MKGSLAPYTVGELHIKMNNLITSGRSVAVAVLEDRRRYVAGSDAGFLPDVRVVVGCIAKCLTATLLARYMSTSSLGMRDQVPDVLCLASSSAREVLEGVEFAHLLNHTHGLDDADIDFDAVPRRYDGSIDVDVLCAKLGEAPRLGEPGEIYSYGGTGSWLIAAYLEQQFGCGYLEILRSELLDPLGIMIAPGIEEHGICPAWGGELALSAVDLIKFLRPNLPENGVAAQTGFRLLREGKVAMPGWCPWQHAATCGWNVYGRNWLGHSGNRDGTGIALRFHRSKPLAIAITAKREADCLFALATLFGEVLEEFSGDYVRIPRTLDPDSWNAKDPSRLLGSYENARWRIHIAKSARSGFLRMRVFDRRTLSSGSILDRHLRAAENDVFLAVPHGFDYPFVQFIGGETETMHATYLWNGRQLWRFVG